MGCFSWIKSDTKKPLLIGESGYLLSPDGNHIYETWYDGYGRFDGKDVYELVALWNREYIAANPDQKTPYRGIPFRNYNWWQIFSDLTIKNEDIKSALADAKVTASGRGIELRNIGIDIACYDEDNEALPYPIKICELPHPYSSQTASESDPSQGGIF